MTIVGHLNTSLPAISKTIASDGGEICLLFNSPYLHKDFTFLVEINYCYHLQSEYNGLVADDLRDKKYDTGAVAGYLT